MTTVTTIKKTTAKKAGSKKVGAEQSGAVRPQGGPALDWLDVASIQTRENVRSEIDPAGVAELAADIEVNGILQPLLVRVIEGAPFVIAGHRRLAAAKLAGLKFVPAMVGTLDDDAAELMQFAENIQREDMSAHDEARVVWRLLEQLGNLTAVAEKVHKSLPWCSKRAAVMKPDYPFHIRKLLEDAVTADFDLLNTLAKLCEYKADWELAESVRRGEIDRAKARELLKAAQSGKPDQPEKNEKAPSKAPKTATPEEVAAAAERARMQIAVQQMEAWRVVEAAGAEDMEAAAELWKDLEPEAATFWKGFFSGLDHGSNGMSFLIGYSAAVVANDGDRDQIILKLWAINYGPEIASMTPEAILHAFMRSFGSHVISHAKDINAK
jgi:ParB/RepB/Spo0J family partition protein